jgi:hypothetical protein
LLLLLTYRTLQPTNMDETNDDKDDSITSSYYSTSNCSNKENVMGRTSQSRKKATRRKKHRPKHILVDNNNKRVDKQTTLFGVAAPTDVFDRLQYCKVCRAINEGRTAPHIAHHFRCKDNTKYGLLRLNEKQAQLVAEADKLEKLNNKKLPLTDQQKQLLKDARELEKKNKAPFGLHEKARPIKNQAQLLAFLAPRTKKPTPPLAPPLATTTTTTINPYVKNKTEKTTPHSPVKKAIEVVLKPTTLLDNGSDSNKNSVADSNMELTDNNGSVSPSNDVPSCHNNFTSNIPTTGGAIEENNSTTGEFVSGIPTAAVLREYVDENMVLEKQQSKRNGCPSPLIYVVKYLRENYFPSRLNNDSNKLPETTLTVAMMKKYASIFPPGTMEFTIPKESRLIKPSPWYHSIEGTKLLFVQWELNFPGVHLGCTCCSGELIHDRTNFSKNFELFPIFNSGAPHMWASIMYYKCNLCETRVAGNSGELLNSLSPFVRSAYPVHPRYAVGSFHLSKNTSDLLEDLMITYGNGEHFSRSMYQRLNYEYLNRIDTYYDQCKMMQHKNVLEYPQLCEWTGQQYPDGAKFREIYDKAQQSNLTRSGIPETERYTREIQGVGCSLSMAQDHTMEVVKNYKNGDVRACWTACNEHGEIACAILVTNTKGSQFAHAAECLVRRNNFKPKVMYADTWPHMTKFWALLLGSTCIGRLGLFHFMTRILKTLRDSHIDYRKSILELRKAIYKYDEMDYMRLVHSLKEGKMARSGTKYTEGDIYDLQISGKWKQRYDKWLRKVIFDTQTLRDNLNIWFDNFKVTTTRTGDEALKRPA